MGVGWSYGREKLWRTLIEPRAAVLREGWFIHGDWTRMGEMTMWWVREGGQEDGLASSGGHGGRVAAGRA